MPDIAFPDQQDSISAKGFSLGYIGSVILLIANLAIYTYPETFGFSSDIQANKFGFILVGIWWIGFAQIPFKFLKDEKKDVKIDMSIISSGFKEIQKKGYGIWTPLRTKRKKGIR